MKLDALVYDLETLRGVPDRRRPRLAGIEYCQGWEDYAGMGIAVVCAYDFLTGRYRVFEADNLAEFVELLAARALLVSYNGLRFDNNVIAASTGAVIDPDRCYDVLAMLKQAKGVPANGAHAPGLSLDGVAQANFGIAKSFNGALAPVYWQRGQRGIVVDYCLEDVRLTRGLFERVVQRGELKDPVGRLFAMPPAPGSPYAIAAGAGVPELQRT